MRIADSEAAFRSLLAAHGKAPEQLLPEELLHFGFTFFEQARFSDARPATDAGFGDALLLQWGTREALPPHYGACFYVDLTRQFIAEAEEDEDAMFQLTCQLQYELSPALRALGTDHRWCSSLEGLPAFRSFALSHPAIAAVRRRHPENIELYLTPV